MTVTADEGQVNAMHDGTSIQNFISFLVCLTFKVLLWDGSAQATAHAATQRQKLEIKVATPLGHDTGHTVELGAIF